MDKKDILELNKKNRQIDEGEAFLNGRGGYFASRFVYFTTFVLIQLNINTRLENWATSQHLWAVVFSLGFGDSLGRYRISKKKCDLVGAIIFGVIWLFLFGSLLYGHVTADPSLDILAWLKAQVLRAMGDT